MNFHPQVWWEKKVSVGLSDENLPLAPGNEFLLLPHQSSLKTANMLRDVGKVTTTLAIPHCYTFIIEKKIHKTIFVHGLVST